MLLAAAVAALVWVERRRALVRPRSGARELSIDVGGRGVSLDLRAVGQQRPDDVLLLRRRARGAARVRPRRAARARGASRCRCSPRSAGWSCRSRSTSRSTPAARRRTAGASRCRPTRRSRSALLALVGPRFPDRLRAFMLTVAVVDDLVALLVIATVYTERPRGSRARSSRSALFAVVLVVRALRRPARAVYALARRARRGSRCSKSGVDPVVVGLAMGLLTYAYPAARSRPRARDRALPRASASSRRPSSRARRSAGVAVAISPNERLQQLFHPWTSYVIVPLFALANAGHRRRRRLARPGASRSPITLGILVGYVVGKPSGIVGVTWLVDPAQPRAAAPAGRLGRGRRRRHDRGHRLHRLAADRHARVRRASARGGEARRPRRGAARDGAHVAALPGDRAAAADGCGSRAARREAPSRSSTSSSPVDPERDHIRGPAGRAGHARRVRRLRVPLLRPGRAGRPRAARRLRRRCATSGATCR